jgi:hypothetical protein
VALSESSTLVAGECSGSFEAFAAARTFTLTGSDGNKSLFACLRDCAGNTREVTDTITLDRTPPTPVSLSVPALTSNAALDVGLLIPADAVQTALAEGSLDCANTASLKQPTTVRAVD